MERPWIEVDISTPKHPGKKMKIDVQDWKYLQSIRIGKVCAYQDKNAKIVYAWCRIGSKVRKIHRILLPESIMVDHKNHDGTDNRRSNIRSVTHRQN